MICVDEHTIYTLEISGKELQKIAVVLHKFITDPPPITKFSRPDEWWEDLNELLDDIQDIRGKNDRQDLVTMGRVNHK